MSSSLDRSPSAPVSQPEDLCPVCGDPTSIGVIFSCPACIETSQALTLAKSREKAAQYVAGLRELASFIESHPEFEAHDSYPNKIELTLYPGTADAFALQSRALMDGGKIEKDATEASMTVSRSFGPHELCLYVSREQVCERHQVGTRTVEKPDPEALKVVRTITVEEPVYEWKCKPVLLYLDSEVLA